MGRKKGSKNKPKTIEPIEKDNTILPILFGNEKDIKKEIRALKKLKLQCKSGSKERIDLYRKIKELKNKLIDQNKPEPEKDKIIAEILKLDRVMASIDIDLKKHSIEDLQKYLNKL